MQIAQTNIPILSGQVFRSPAGYDLIKILCPFCGRIHVHGFDGNLMSKRCSHCMDKYSHEREYFLTPLAVGGVQ